VTNHNSVWQQRAASRDKKREFMSYTPASDYFGKTDSNRFGPSQGTPAWRRII